MDEADWSARLSDAKYLARARTALWARSRLASIAMLCVRVRSLVPALGETDIDVFGRKLEDLEVEIADQHATLAPLDDVLGPLEKVARDAAADAARSMALAEDLLAESEKLNRLLAQETARSAMLQAQIGRLSEHRQQHDHIRDRVWGATNGKCFYCCVEMTKDAGHQHSFVVDHIVPKNAGGPDHLANFIPACARCNGEKSDKPFIEFVARLSGRSTPVLRVVSGNEGAQ